MSNAQNAPAENKMGTMPVNKLLVTMALPMILSMLVQALYNVVDSVFVSRISEDALTAVSMAFPMQNLMIGMGSGMAVGTNALLSRALGEKRPQVANQMAMHGIFLSICCYLIFLLLGLTITRPFFLAQGASDAIADYGYSYLFIILVFSFGIFFQLIFERLLQSTGKTVYTMITQLSGAIINLILDPLLIFGLAGFPRLGIAGAAIATVTGQCIAAVMGLILNLKVNTELSLNPREFRLQLRIIGSILFIGVPSVIMVAIGSIMIFSIDKILVVFSSTAVAVFGVYFKLQSFVFMPIFGLNNGMVPIVAYNYGARNPERMMKTVKLSMMYAVGIMLIGLICIQLFPGQMLMLFDASADMLQIGIPALRIISLSFLFAGVCIIASSFFQALGNGIFSMLISFTRQLIVLVPLAYIFSKTGNLAMVWVAWPLAEIVTILLSLFFMRLTYNKHIRPMESGSIQKA